MKAAGKEDDAEGSEEVQAERARFWQLVSFIVELAMIDLLDLKMLKYLPSLLVASAVHTALLVRSFLALEWCRRGAGWVKMSGEAGAQGAELDAAAAAPHPILPPRHGLPPDTLTRPSLCVF